MDFDDLDARDLDLFKAGYAHVDEMMEHADAIDHRAPMWYGWALRSAFWAGAMWQKNRTTPPHSSDSASAER
jgi:hypothetical protein